MRTIRALHILSAAILGVALVNGGSADARRAPRQSLSIAAINQSACSDTTVPSPTMAAMFNAEVLLDRLDLSPGVVDGKAGENAGKAIRAFQRSRGLAVNGNLDQETWNKLCESRRMPVLIAYMVTEDDVRGPFLRKIPRNFEGMASLRALSYRSVTQLLAEKFHTSGELIKLLKAFSV